VGLHAAAHRPVAVEELPRWVSPVKNMSRTVTTDVELGGQHLCEGDEVMVFFPSVNRDEAVFAAPDTFDVRRDPNPHLASAFGPHLCLGASLARLELKVMFREVLARLADLELAPGEALPLRPSNFAISGAMPVRFTPTPTPATATSTA
jgi:cholest-4-en-3-one 26-monooxygenase